MMTQNKILSILVNHLYIILNVLYAWFHFKLCSCYVINTQWEVTASKYYGWICFYWWQLKLFRLLVGWLIAFPLNVWFHSSATTRRSLNTNNNNKLTYYHHDCIRLDWFGVDSFLLHVSKISKTVSNYQYKMYEDPIEDQPLLRILDSMAGALHWSYPSILTNQVYNS